MGRGGWILLVEDEPDLVRIMTEALQEEGYEVVVALNGPNALELLERETPGLILLDLRMPKMTGAELLAAYRERHQTTAPVVVVTAASNAAASTAGLNVDAVLSKPFDLDDLIKVVERFVTPLTEQKAVTSERND